MREGNKRRECFLDRWGVMCLLWVLEKELNGLGYPEDGAALHLKIRALSFYREEIYQHMLT